MDLVVTNLEALIVRPLRRSVQMSELLINFFEPGYAENTKFH
jgi:hypothetical protein